MRLTKKLTKKNKYLKYINKDTSDKTDFGILNKLGQLEDIEEELGIDLITLFKALKNGIYYKHELNNEIEYHDCRGIALQGIGVVNNLCSYGECDFTAYYKDYGKTWALTKEEL